MYSFIKVNNLNFYYIIVILKNYIKLIFKIIKNQNEIITYNLEDNKCI
jgi:hypothetical protein